MKMYNNDQIKSNPNKRTQNSKFKIQGSRPGGKTLNPEPGTARGARPRRPLRTFARHRFSDRLKISNALADSAPTPPRATGSLCSQTSSPHPKFPPGGKINQSRATHLTEQSILISPSSPISKRSTWIAIRPCR